MKIFVQAKPGASEDSVKEIDNNNFLVFVKEPPLQGRANKAIIKVLSKHLDIAPSRLRIVSGYTGRRKIIEIL